MAAMGHVLRNSMRLGERRGGDTPQRKDDGTGVKSFAIKTAKGPRLASPPKKGGEGVVENCRDLEGGGGSTRANSLEKKRGERTRRRGGPWFLTAKAVQHVKFSEEDQGKRKRGRGRFLYTENTGLKARGQQKKKGRTMA